MKIDLETIHINILQSIAAYAVKVQEQGSIDTGPGGEGPEELATRLRNLETEFEYWLGLDDD